MRALVKYKNGKEEEFEVRSTIEVFVEHPSHREFLQFPASKTEKVNYYFDECEITLKAD